MQGHPKHGGRHKRRSTVILVGSRPATRPREVTTETQGGGEPQVGGVETITELLLASDLLRRFRVVSLDSSKRGAGKETSGRLNLYNLRAALALLVRLEVLLVRERPAILHVPVTSQFFAFLRDAALIWLAWLHGARVISHVHGGSFDAFWHRANWPLRAFIRTTLSRSARVVALSPYWARVLLGIVRDPTKVTVIWNSVDVDAYTGEREPQTEHPGRPRLIFLGAIGRRKGVPELLRAVAVLRDRRIDLDVVLVGPEEYTGELAEAHQICDELELTQQVHFAGTLFGRDKITALKSADLFVLPSHNEGLPLALLEAMAAGLPIVATRAGGIPDVVDDGVHGLLVKPGDVAGLAQAIEHLIVDRDLARNMATGNVAYVQRFCPDRMVADIATLYEILGA